MKDLCVKVSVKTINLGISRSRLAGYTSKNSTKVCAARAARLFFPIQAIRLLFSQWRCLCRCRRLCLGSLMTNDDGCASDSDDDHYDDDNSNHNSSDLEKYSVLFSCPIFSLFPRLRHLLKWNLLTSTQTIQILLDTLSKYKWILRCRAPSTPG